MEYGPYNPIPEHFGLVEQGGFPISVGPWK